MNIEPKPRGHASQDARMPEKGSKLHEILNAQPIPARDGQKASAFPTVFTNRKYWNNSDRFSK